MDLQEFSPASLLEMRRQLARQDHGFHGAPQMSSQDSDLSSGRQLSHQDSGFHTMSFKNDNFMSAEEEGRANSLQDPEAGKPEAEPLLSPESECSGSDATSLPVTTRNALRRQGTQDGDRNERQSLLVEEPDPDDETCLDDPPDTFTVLQNPNTTIVDDTLAMPLASRSHKDAIELEPMAAAGATGGVPLEPLRRREALRRHSAGASIGEGNPAHLPAQGRRKLSQIPETTRKKRIQILQRELGRIRQELESLGEIEIEVSYV